VGVGRGAGWAGHNRLMLEVHKWLPEICSDIYQPIGPPDSAGVSQRVSMSAEVSACMHAHAILDVIIHCCRSSTSTSTPLSRMRPLGLIPTTLREVQVGQLVSQSCLIQLPHWTERFCNTSKAQSLPLSMWRDDTAGMLCLNCDASTALAKPGC
jgi:hypothetical protein